MYLDYFLENLDVVGELTVEHIRISFLALAIALPLALALGITAVLVRPIRQPVMWIVGALYTVPSLAMIAFLIPSQGLGLRPTLILLVLYAQVFLVRNIVTGMTGVDRAVLEAAQGVGMTPVQVLIKVWLPIALPVILAGVRITLTTTIGLAVLGGWVAAGGLGELLFTGIGMNHPSRVMAGVIAIVLLALAADLLLRGVESLTPVARARRAGSRR
jgi:osmoprotectant transport system permease protein